MEKISTWMNETELSLKGWGVYQAGFEEKLGSRTWQRYKWGTVDEEL